MIEYTVYDPDGRFYATFTESDDVPNNVPDGYSYVDGIQDQYTRLVEGFGVSAVTPFSQAEIDEIESGNTLADRREERRRKFANTIDKMNPIWYEELSSTGQDDLREWRQTWLDYPSTGVKPDNLSIFD